MLFRSFFFISALLLSLTACSEPYGRNLFVEICDIYAEALHLESSPTEKWGFVINAVKSDHPDFYQDNYIYIMDMDPSDRYNVYKKLEHELVGSDNWECPEMRLFFAELEAS